MRLARANTGPSDPDSCMQKMNKYQYGDYVTPVQQGLMRMSQGGATSGQSLLMVAHGALIFEGVLAAAAAFLYIFVIFDYFYMEPIWALVILLVQMACGIILVVGTFALSPIWMGDSGVHHWIYNTGVDRHGNDMYNWQLFTTGLSCLMHYLVLLVPFIFIWARYSSVIEDEASWNLALTTASNGLETVTNGAIYYKLFFVASGIVCGLVAATSLRSGHTWYNHGMKAKY